MKTRDSLARAAVGGVALFIFSRPGFAQDQDQPEPQILLGRVGETYRNLKSYRFVIDCYGVKGQRAQQVESKSRSEERVLLAACKPNLLRIELKNRRSA